MARRDPGPIPNRWLKCPRKAEEFIDSKLFAFKTPLGSEFNNKVPETCRFTPSMLFHFLKSKNVQMGLWIDLTNTDRFYNKTEIVNMDCQYIKLKCRGHGETPSEQQTQEFINIVRDFISQNPLKMIGVHCTHGFNRTGFLLVSYMVNVLDCSVNAAINEFAKVRPPGIYKQDYIDELCKRYDADFVPNAPLLPDWCYEEEENNEEVYGDEQEPEQEDEDDDDDEEDDSSNSHQPKKKKSKRSVQVKMFMPGIEKVEQFVLQPKLKKIQKKAQKMCGWRNGFPGSQPVSMDRDNLKLLKKNPYRVSWKADGTRYMMLIDGENEVYMFDRDNCVFKVSGISFRHRKDLRKHLKDTLLDGEMVIDKFNGEEIPRYLCYDIISFEGDDIGRRPFYPDRLCCIEKEIVSPRNEAIKHGLIRKEKEPFSIRQKQFWDVTQTKALLGERFAKQLAHEPDGLIFQPSKEPYIAGTCTSVLKWKPARMNSVDFQLKIGVEEGVGILKKKIGQLYAGQFDRPFGYIRLTKDIKELDNKIIECKFENNQWVFMRERTDKSFPNHYKTVEAVCRSFTYPVTEEMLLNYVDRERYRDDSEYHAAATHRI